MDALNSVPGWIRKYYAEVASYFSEINTEMLQRDIAIPGIERIEKKWNITPHTANLAQTMVQVVTHSMYHRAQIVTQLREFEVEPPVIDFIVWIWFGKPQAKWPSN
jgi:uncharacterized damage-inducible protein DinB